MSSKQRQQAALFITADKNSKWLDKGECGGKTEICSFDKLKKFRTKFNAPDFFASLMT